MQEKGKARIGAELVLEKGDFQLFREKIGPTPWSAIPELVEGIYCYSLRKKSGAKLLNMTCSQRPEGRNANLFVIGTLESKSPNGIFFFSRLVKMIRSDLRSFKRNADLVSLTPDPKMKSFYLRIGARKRSGFFRFPRNLAAKRRK